MTFETGTADTSLSFIYFCAAGIAPRDIQNLFTRAPES